MANHRLLLPKTPPGATTTTTTTTTTTNEQQPLVICFHGSGEACSPSWDALAGLLVSQLSLRVLLYDRGPLNPRPEEATADLRAHLRRARLWPGPGPCILIAHSYGGAFARTFVRRCPDRVAGAVLVETGQEGGLDPETDEAQRARCALGPKPLSVVRGNTLLAKWGELEAAEAEIRARGAPPAGGEEKEKEKEKVESLRLQRELLRVSDEEDERLKKRQLDMSRNARYVHIPDCGHHVVRDRPDVVVAEVRWVLENMEKDGGRNENRERGFWTRAVGKLCSKLRI